MVTNNRTEIKAAPGQLDYIIIREFDYPGTLVFKAFIDPNLYVQWLSPRRFKMILETFEPRNGGRWRYIHVDKDGKEFGFHGVFHEVLEPKRIIDSFEFEGLPETGHVSLETAKFEELPGYRTRLMIQAVFQSLVDRDGMLSSGMEQGISESFDRLDELLKKMLPP